MQTYKLLLLSALIAVSTVTLAQTPDTPAAATCPSATGAYLRAGGDWKLMEIGHAIGFKTTGVAKTAFSYGAAAAHVKAQFRDAASPYHLDNPNAEICIVGLIDTGRDITVASFQREKDHRELPLGSLRIWTGINAQIDPKHIVPADVTKLADKTYLVKSKEALKDGEYILFTLIPDIQSLVKANTPTSLGGYDFGVHTK